MTTPISLRARRPCFGCPFSPFNPHTHTLGSQLSDVSRVFRFLLHHPRGYWVALSLRLHHCECSMVCVAFTRAYIYMGGIAFVSSFFLIALLYSTLRNMSLLSTSSFTLFGEMFHIWNVGRSHFSKAGVMSCTTLPPIFAIWRIVFGAR